MSQQLQLFSGEPFSAEEQDSSSGSLIAQTRQLFHHQGSNAELIDRIKAVIQTIDERCREPNLK